MVAIPFKKNQLRKSKSKFKRG